VSGAAVGRVFATSGPWLFSRRIDLCAFFGSALLAWLAVAVGAALSLLDRELGDVPFLLCIVAVDVAHVWATGFRVYFDGGELRTRPLLYWGLPLFAYALGVMLLAISVLTFWRVLAYVAVFHFVRQQAGFMALYGKRDPSSTRFDRALDGATMYASTLYPVAYWHVHPRSFDWFLSGDFLALDQAEGAKLVTHLEPALFLLLGLFFARQLVLLRRGRLVPGKSLLVLATFSCWYGGIVLFDSDYVFTVTNVLLHGIPYFVLTHRYARATSRGWAGRIVAIGILPFALVCLALALGEELLWDRLVFHDRPHLFGAHGELSSLLLLFVTPLLAVPQLTHYLLDGFVWRVRSENPVLRREFEAA
jgi:hypothetical protein